MSNETTIAAADEISTACALNRAEPLSVKNGHSAFSENAPEWVRSLLVEATGSDAPQNHLFEAFHQAAEVVFDGDDEDEFVDVISQIAQHNTTVSDAEAREIFRAVLAACAKGATA